MHGNVPVRFGRGRLDSLGNKGLAAYLIARSDGPSASHLAVHLLRHILAPLPLTRRGDGTLPRAKLRAGAEHV